MGNNNIVELIDEDGTTVINSLTTSEALGIDGDSNSATCSIDNSEDTFSDPTPGSANNCQ